jgi:MraZ protein
MAMPMRFRDSFVSASEGQLVITIDTEEACLMIYPLAEWEGIQDKLQQLPSFNPAVRRIQRLLIGHATDLALDANGRILLPAVLREYAQLDKKAILLGQGKKIELWSELLWYTRRDEYLQIASDSNEFPNAMYELAL